MQLPKTTEVYKSRLQISDASMIYLNTLSQLVKKVFFSSTADRKA